MGSFVEKLCNFIDSLNEVVGRTIAWLVLAMVLITFAVVVMRKGFAMGSISLQETITYLHAFVFMLAGAYTLKHNEHVRVDIFYQEMSAKNKARVDFFGSLLFLLPFALFIVWISFNYVLKSWEMLEQSREAGGLPIVYILKTLIPVMAILLFLQALSICGQSWLKIKSN